MLSENFSKLSICCKLTLLVCCLVTSRTMAQQATIKQATVRQAPVEATLQLASVFSDHMVLQRDQAIPVWGNAEPGTVVRVKLGGKTREATSDADGKWRVDLAPEAAGGPLEMQVSSERVALQLTDILVGEVWVASGQSNMEWSVANSNEAAQELATADWPQIRFWNAPRVIAVQPQDRISNSGWQVCRPDSIKGFSAVAYFFGRELHKKIQVPIGLVGSNYGGTPMEAWTSRTALESRPTFAGAAKVAAAPASDTKLPGGHPSGLFNGMIQPLIPYGMRGVIWYQGEANAGRPQHYRELSALMISDWRKRWAQGDFPFLLVQLAGYTPKSVKWPFLREAQLQTAQTVPNVGMVVATDLGNRADIHPRNKQDVGKRLALAARALAYDEDLVYSGPIYKSMTTSNGRVHLNFEHLGRGLEAKGGELLGFMIASDDRNFVPAEAIIVGDQVVVSSDQVHQPVAVRYNWSGWTEGNLYNAEGLPAAPFRTDRF